MNINAPSPAIWWIRRDLRLEDNDALAAALAHSSHVIPLFIFDPQLLGTNYSGEKREAFLYGALRDLDRQLRGRGSRLILRRGSPVEELAAFVRESGATAVFAEDDHSPFARRRDTAAAAIVPLRLVGSSAMRPAGTVLKSDGTPYTVFTPFSKAWLAQSLPHERELPKAPAHLGDPGEWPSVGIPDAPVLPASVPFRPTATEAARRLDAFVNGPVNTYYDDRNRMDLDGTSRLSPYLRFGLLAPRRAAVAAIEAQARATDAEARKGATHFLSELIWRDFYIHILYHYPHVSKGSFRPEYDRIIWHNDEADFEAWRKGVTGYPVVDAAMRQLTATGWMHNRARMIVASFLVKDLLIDWRWGERWFMQHLIDGDVASNNGGWQWTAGTGTDAAPYFRIFNPVMQSAKFDPTGTYIRRWVPELAGVSLDRLHEPWTMTPMEQRMAGCVIGRDYPRPIIDHHESRDRTLAAYARAKEATA